MFSCFDIIPACDGQTDIRTDGHLATPDRAIRELKINCQSYDSSSLFCQRAYRMHVTFTGCRPESIIRNSNSSKLCCIADEQKQERASRYEAAHRDLNAENLTYGQPQLLDHQTADDGATGSGRQKNNACKTTGTLYEQILLLHHSILTLL